MPGTNISLTSTPRSRTGCFETTIVNGATVPRAQHAKSYRLNGIHSGKSTISGGSDGTPNHGYAPKSASQIFVNTRAFVTPPKRWITSSAFRIGSLPVSTPSTFSATYASIVVLRSAGPS